MSLGSAEAYIEFKKTDTKGPPLPPWWPDVRFGPGTASPLGDRVREAATRLHDCGRPHSCRDLFTRSSARAATCRGITIGVRPAIVQVERHRTLRPPSTATVAPVTNDDSSLARSSTRCAISRLADAADGAIARLGAQRVRVPRPAPSSIIGVLDHARVHDVDAMPSGARPRRRCA